MKFNRLVLAAFFMMISSKVSAEFQPITPINRGGTGATTSAIAIENLGLGLNSNPQFRSLSLQNIRSTRDLLIDSYYDEPGGDFTLRTKSVLNFDIAYHVTYHLDEYGLDLVGHPIRSGVWHGSAIDDDYISSSANWNTAYSDRLKWDGGATGLNAGTGRESLGLSSSNDVSFNSIGIGTAPSASYSLNVVGDSHLFGIVDGVDSLYANHLYAQDIMNIDTIQRLTAGNTYIASYPAYGTVFLDGYGNTPLLVDNTGILIDHGGITQTSSTSPNVLMSKTGFGVANPTYNVDSVDYVNTGTAYKIGGTTVMTTSTVSNWNTAYTDRLKWDGGSSGLNAGTGRSSLGLGSMAIQATSDYVTTSNLLSVSTLGISSGGLIALSGTNTSANIKNDNNGFVFSQNNEAKFKIRSTGTSSASAQVLIDDQSSSAMPAYSFISDNSSGFGYNGTGLTFSTSGTQRAYITSTGLGIGTTPDAPLTVGGVLHLLADTNTSLVNLAFHYSNINPSNQYYTGLSYDNNNGATFQYALSHVFYLDSTGKNGIFSIQKRVWNYGTNSYDVTAVPFYAGFASTSNPIVGIGTDSPASGAILDVSSTVRGFLPPRMTTTQKNAISSPAEGLIVYDTTLHKLCVFTGSTWETVTSL